ncbi:pentapeptide repeat-containing protein [Arthrobacter sp. 2MCAF14]
MFGAVIAATAIAFIAHMVLQWVLPHGGDPIQPKDLTQFSLTIVAGIGGVVALVVAYRRQGGIEQSRFVERFGAAASQLGHSDVAVRMAGVYAMAGVADETVAHERQQCVDVLCGYLRLPYSPELGSNHQAELQRKVPAREGEESTRRYLYRQNDKEVRQTIIRVIKSHLQRDVRESWSPCAFDFRGAVLEDANFDRAIFVGYPTTFDRAMFIGAETSFHAAKLNAVSFKGTRFSATETSFDVAGFSSSSSFEGAVFSGAKTSFQGAFSTHHHEVTFEGAMFLGTETSFCEAEFVSPTNFRGCNFGEGRVDFSWPRQWVPGAARFDWDERLPAEERKPRPGNVLPPAPEWPPKRHPKAPPPVTGHSYFLEEGEEFVRAFVVRRGMRKPKRVPK